MIQEAVWHDDGHQIHLELNKAEVVIASVSCPHTGTCAHPETHCLVEHFLSLYGLECNIGIAPAEPDMQIAWTIQGNTHSLEKCQVWIIPSNDMLFSAFAESARTSSSEAS